MKSYNPEDSKMENTEAVEKEVERVSGDGLSSARIGSVLTLCITGQILLVFFAGPSLTLLISGIAILFLCLLAKYSCTTLSEDAPSKSESGLSSGAHGAEPVKEVEVI